MKPVTELYEEAEGWAQGVSDAHGEDGLLRAVGAIDRLAGSVGTSALLEVLDLVATLPPERLEEVRRCVEGEGEKRWRAALGPWNDDGVSVETCIGLMRRTLDAYKGLPQITSPQLGLVRWVVGLSEEETAALGEALSDYQKCVEGGGDSESQAIVGRLMDRWDVALSGGEGGAKDEDIKPREPGCQCHIEEGDSPCRVHGEDEDSTKSEDEIRALEARLSEVRAKISNYDGRDWTASQHVALLRQEAELSMRLHSLKSERDQAQCRPTILPAEEEKHELGPRLAEVMRQIDEYEGDDREHRAPQALLREADELAARLEAATPKPTILPAGKPPPFLRVGMVLCVPGAPCGDIRIRGEEVDGRVQVSGIDGSTWLASVSRLRAEWVLAEPFTVERES